ncbi:hypothetical protein [Streptomyces sp. B93]|uniref:hypothetical protein n=1 Tax=Streptomyces sp. B93 TaxID=2824875 RepID=UPI001B36101C|nr:hypothetical protein [Streptomyces sp. B93]MBQ1092233.1 hypothetical protein [Streptomyces sp. B93]
MTAWLTAAGSDPPRTATTSSMVGDAARLTATVEIDRAGEAVWEYQDGGPGRLRPRRRPRNTP